MASTAPCAACSKFLPQQAFSGTQWKKTRKGNVGRCKQCIEASMPVGGDSQSGVALPGQIFAEPQAVSPTSNNLQNNPPSKKRKRADSRVENAVPQDLGRDSSSKGDDWRVSLSRTEGIDGDMNRIVEDLVLFYKQYNPPRGELRKAHRRLALKYESREGAMWKFLRRKYVLEPQSRRRKKEQGQRGREQLPLGCSGVCAREDEEPGAAEKRKRVDDDGGGRSEAPPFSLKCSASDDLAPALSAALTICDKCDGPHATALCPYFRKVRENHPDALRRRAALTGMGGAGGSVFVTGAQPVRQPGDGSCLFHSMNHGLRLLETRGILRGSNLSGKLAGAKRLRSDIARWVMSHPNVRISDTPLQQWVKWDSGLKLGKYASQMARGGSWGGGIELASCSILRGVNVHVYERYRGSGSSGGGRSGNYKGGEKAFLRISCFGDAPKDRTVHVLYCGGVHYDALNVDNATFHKLPDKISSDSGGKSLRLRQNQHKRSRRLSGKKNNWTTTMKKTTGGRRRC